MTQKPTDGTSADGKKVVETVEEITKVISLSSEAEEAKKASHQQNVVTVCPLCELGIKPDEIDFYNIALLKKFISVRGKVIPRSKTGLCAAHQRAVIRAIKRARYLALLPYVNVGV